MSEEILRTNQYTLSLDYEFPDLEPEETDKLQGGYLFLTLSLLYDSVCYKKEKLLVGIEDDAPLWMPLPAFLDNKHLMAHIFKWMYVAILVYPCLKFLSGETKQQVYDRLLLPAQNRWPPLSFWKKESIVNFEKSIAQGLGYKRGLLTYDDLYEVLVQISLERRYTLVDQKPVLVRLPEQRMIKQIWLIPKGGSLLTKIETMLGFDLVNFISSDEGIWGGMFQALPFELEEGGYAIPVLIAHIYKTLVTVEELESSGQTALRVSPASKPEESTKDKISYNWQYIPRRQYLRNGGNEAVERVPLINPPA